MSHRASPREQLNDQPRFRLFEIGVPDDADSGWAAEVVGGMTDAEAEAWNAGRLAGADPFGRALRAVDAVARWDDTDAGFIWRLGVALSAPAAAVLGRLVGDECLFVPVEVEAGGERREWFLPNPRVTVERVQVSRVVRGQRRVYEVVPSSAAELAVFRHRGSRQEAACMLRRDVCEALMAAGLALSMWGAVDEGVLVGQEG